MRRVRTIAPALLGVFAAAGLGASEPPTVTYYDVHGDSLQDAGQWMDRHGPSGADGRRFHGYTRWAVSWRYQLQPSRDACTVALLETDLRVTMQLPRWHQPEGLPATAAREWDRYSAALRAHEDGHADIGAAVADAIGRELAAMRNTSGCPALAQEIDRRGMEILEDHRARELQYDATTGHGASQGARLRVDVSR